MCDFARDEFVCNRFSLLLQALRLALLQHMFLKAVAVPAFSRANDISRRDVIARPVTDAPTTQVALVWPIDAPSDLIDEFIGIVRGRTANSSRGQVAVPEEKPAARPAAKPGAKSGAKPVARAGQKPRRGAPPRPRKR